MNDDKRDYIAWRGAQEIITFLELYGFYRVDDTSDVLRFSDSTILSLRWNRSAGLYWLVYIARGDDINWDALRGAITRQCQFDDQSYWYSFEDRFMTLAVRLSTQTLLSQR